jgi:flagellar basal-body rod modification protein FlgD
MSTVASTTAASSLLNSLNGKPASTTVGPQANDGQMNQFLTLLTAQLKNQDPMQPTDPTQFVAQLAQFSTVEQLVQGNTKLDTISQSLSGLALGQYAGLISHTVGATASKVMVPDAGSPAQMTFHVTAPSLAGIHVEITDASGNLVRTLPVSGSDGTIAFDGNGNNGMRLPTGQYGVALVGLTNQGAPQSAGTLTTSGTVSGVMQGASGGWQLQLNDGRVVDAATVTSVL